MDNRDEVERYMSLFEAYKNQINMLNEQYKFLQAMINDYQRARITIENLNKNDENTDVLFPVGSGVFVNANARKTGKVLIDVGADIVMEKSVDEAVKKINGRIESLQKNLDNVSENIQKMQKNASELGRRIQSLNG